MSKLDEDKFEEIILERLYCEYRTSNNGWAYNLAAEKRYDEMTKIKMENFKAKSDGHLYIGTTCPADNTKSYVGRCFDCKYCEYYDDMPDTGDYYQKRFIYCFGKLDSFKFINNTKNLKFDIGNNIISKKTILNWLDIELINWKSFLWYIADYSTIVDFNNDCFTVKISSNKQWDFFISKVKSYFGNMEINDYNYEGSKTNETWKDHKIGSERNYKILLRLLEVDLDSPLSVEVNDFEDKNSELIQTMDVKIIANEIKALHDAKTIKKVYIRIDMKTEHLMSNITAIASKYPGTDNLILYNADNNQRYGFNNTIGFCENFHKEITKLLNDAESVIVR